MESRTIYLIGNMRRKFKKRLMYLLLVVCLVAIILFGSLATFLFERNNNPAINTYSDAVWLSFVTMTTVGYGDSYPITAGGRVTGIVSMVLGISLLSIFITTRAAVRVEKTKRRRMGLEKAVKTRGHYLVCGWNDHGISTLSALREGVRKSMIPIVLLADLEEKPVDDDHIIFVRGNQVSEKDLIRANAGEARAALLLADVAGGGGKGDIDARTVLSALTLRALAENIPITAEALEPENVYHLKMAGVDEILDSNTMAGNLLARSALHYGLIGIVSELVEFGGARRVYKVPVSNEMVGREYGQIVSDMQAECDCALVAIDSGGRIGQKRRSDLAEKGESLLVFADKKPPGAAG